MNKRAFIDTEVLTSHAFMILAGMSLAALALGYKFSGQMFESGGGWSIWQIIVLMVGSVIASYFFAARG